LQPVASVLIYSGLFGVLLQVPSGDAPYPVFVLCGLLPWQYFAGSLAKSSNSLVDNSNLITKVYFPRLSIPLANILSGLVDFAIASSVLVVFMLIYQIHLSATIFFLPIFLMLAILTAMGFGLWFSALNVQYRDVKHLLPFVIQIWMYLTPVIYEVTLIPEPYRWLLALNPMTLVMVGFRWSILGTVDQEMVFAQPAAILSLLVMLLILIGGVVYFRRTERTFADVI
jgi:lipopolysaccharide transport system permease protein